MSHPFIYHPLADDGYFAEYPVPMMPTTIDLARGRVSGFIYPESNGRQPIAVQDVRYIRPTANRFPAKHSERYCTALPGMEPPEFAGPAPVTITAPDGTRVEVIPPAAEPVLETMTVSGGVYIGTDGKAYADEAAATAAGAAAPVVPGPAPTAEAVAAAAAADPVVQASAIAGVAPDPILDEPPATAPVIAPTE